MGPPADFATHADGWLHQIFLRELPAHVRTSHQLNMAPAMVIRLERSAKGATQRILVTCSHLPCHRRIKAPKVRPKCSLGQRPRIHGFYVLSPEGAAQLAS